MFCDRSLLIILYYLNLTLIAGMSGFEPESTAPNAMYKGLLLIFLTEYIDTYVALTTKLHSNIHKV